MKSAGSSEGKRIKMIYHIAKEKDYIIQAKRDYYVPANFNENGFVHCALEESVLSVANDYFSDNNDKLLLLKIDPSKLKSQTKYESAVPEQNAGIQHLNTSLVFPHVYGPIDISAILEIGILGKGKSGYEWPQIFLPLDKYL